MQLTADKVILTCGITQRELARLVNVAESTISRYVSRTRQPEFSVASRLADITNRSLSMKNGVFVFTSKPKNRRKQK